MEHYDEVRKISYVHGHKDKREYKTLDDAKIASKRLRKTKGPKVYPYRCKFCPHYHIGHRKNTKKIDILRRESGIIKGNGQAVSPSEESGKDTQEGKTL